jgi:hypothetical protein
MNIQELINSLPHCAINWDSPRLGSDDDGLPVEAWGEEMDDGVMICVSAEAGDGVADYYRDMYIEPRLEAWAEEHGAYFEWCNPGRIDCFIEAA